MPRKLCACALVVLISFGGVSIVGGARGADAATGEEALERLQIGLEQRRFLLRGDVISYAVSERGERELAVWARGVHSGGAGPAHRVSGRR